MENLEPGRRNVSDNGMESGKSNPAVGNSGNDSISK